jgi:uncharacterized DUF497 family protein
MDHANFDWDDANIGHIAEHNITPEEAEETLCRDPLDYGFDPDSNGEARWTYLGEAGSGRILVVVITIRGDRARVVTAYDAERRDRLLYLAEKAGRQ